MTIDVDTLGSITLEHLKSYAHLDEGDAQRLVEALRLAAQAEVLTMVSGSEPYPTSMADLRALRLRYICEAAGRLLEPREVAVLFRTTDSAAQALLIRMERLYPAAVDRYLDALVAKTGHWKAAGPAEQPSVIIDFRQTGAWEHAIIRLERAGAADIQTRRTLLTIETPKDLPGDEGLATDMLGVTDKRRQ